MRYKIRTIAKFKSVEKCGITLPEKILTFYPKGTFFKIERFSSSSGEGIKLISGSSPIPSKEELKVYKFEDAI